MPLPNYTHLLHVLPRTSSSSMSLGMQVPGTSRDRSFQGANATKACLLRRSEWRSESVSKRGFPQFVDAVGIEICFGLLRKPAERLERNRCGELAVVLTQLAPTTDLLQELRAAPGAAIVAWLGRCSLAARIKDALLSFHGPFTLSAHGDRNKEAKAEAICPFFYILPYERVLSEVLAVQPQTTSNL